MYSEGDTLVLKDGSIVMVVYVDSTTRLTVCDPMDPANAYTISISKVLDKG